MENSILTMDGDLIQSHEDDEPMNANEEKVLQDESEGEGEDAKDSPIQASQPTRTQTGQAPEKKFHKAPEKQKTVPNRQNNRNRDEKDRNENGTTSQESERPTAKYRAKPMKLLPWRAR